MAHPKRSATSGDRLELGVDIGGTFTDVVLVRGAGQVKTAKVLTTPHEPERAVLEGIAKVLAEEAVTAGQVARLIHATTLATNAIEPPPPSRRARPPACSTCSAWRTQMSWCQSQLASSMSSTSAYCAMPTMSTTWCTRPNAATASPTRRSTSARMVASPMPAMPETSAAI